MSSIVALDPLLAIQSSLLLFEAKKKKIPPFITDLTHCNISIKLDILIVSKNIWLNKIHKGTIDILNKISNYMFSRIVSTIYIFKNESSIQNPKSQRIVARWSYIKEHFRRI